MTNDGTPMTQEEMIHYEEVGGTVKNGSAPGTQPKGMPLGMPFCDVAYLESGCRLHSLNHCENDHIVIVIGNV